MEAQVVIWVASSFRDPHLSAVQWLNDHTVAPFAFFAVQVKAVQIGNSPIAPLFEIVAKPNDWDRQIQKQVSSSEELSGLGKWRIRFWEHLLERHPEQEEWDGRLATSSHWRHVPDSDLWVSIYIGKKGSRLICSRWPKCRHWEHISAVGTSSRSIRKVYWRPSGRWREKRIFLLPKIIR